MSRDGIAGPPAPYEGDSGDEDPRTPQTMRIISATNRASQDEPSTTPAIDPADITRAP